jgi:hypothetical protein
MQKYWGESGGYQYENCFVVYPEDLLKSIVKAQIEVRDYDYYLKKG